MRLLILSLSLLLGMTTITVAQVSLSYNVGKDFNKVAVGYRISNKIVPYAGFQYLSVGFDSKIDGEKESFSANAFMPNLGIKYYLINKEVLKAGLNLGLYKPFLSVKTSDSEFNTDIKQSIENTNILLMELGFVSEYFLHPSFSIGAEYGIRYIKGSFEDKTDGNNIESTSNIKFTYTSLSLNYHF